MLEGLAPIKEWLEQVGYCLRLETEKQVLFTHVCEALVMVEARNYADEWLYLFTAPVSFYIGRQHL